MASQSSADTKTALCRSPAINRGACDAAASSMSRCRLSRASLAETVVITTASRGLSCPSILPEPSRRGSVSPFGPPPALQRTPAFLARLAEAAENTTRKDRRINIRLSDHDLAGIQRKAAEQGIPYQSLISGLIHQFVEGQIAIRSEG